VKNTIDSSFFSIIRLEIIYLTNSTETRESPFVMAFVIAVEYSRLCKLSLTSFVVQTETFILFFFFHRSTIANAIHSQ
jgi:hypothetical protein